MSRIRWIVTPSSTGIAASMVSRNFTNSCCRGRRWHSPMIAPVATSSAAKSEVTRGVRNRACRVRLGPGSSAGSAVSGSAPGTAIVRRRGARWLSRFDLGIGDGPRGAPGRVSSTSPSRRSSRKRWRYLPAVDPVRYPTPKREFHKPQESLLHPNHRDCDFGTSGGFSRSSPTLAHLEFSAHHDVDYQIPTGVFR